MISLTSQTIIQLIPPDSGLIIIVFEAEWCSPCRLQTTILQNLPHLPIFTVDVEEEKELAARWGVRSVPTLIFTNGSMKVLENMVGVRSLAVIETLFAKHS